MVLLCSSKEGKNSRESVILVQALSTLMVELEPGTG